MFKEVLRLSPTGDSLLLVRAVQEDEISQDRAGHQWQHGAVVRAHSDGPGSNACCIVNKFWDFGQDSSPP